MVWAGGGEGVGKVGELGAWSVVAALLYVPGGLPSVGAERMT